jgi:LysM repeat protein
MSDERVAVNLGEICPCLGIADDPAVRCLGASALHRCYADEKPRLVGLRYQVDFCLSGEYESCPRWESPENDAPDVDGVSFLSGLDGQAVRRTLLAAARHLGSVLVGLAWMALAVWAMILLAPLLTATNPGARAGSLQQPTDLSADAGRPPVAVATQPPMTLRVQATPEAAAGEAARQAEQAPEAAPASSRDSGRAPTPAAEPTAVPKVESAPAPQGKTHVVQSKDTLWSLARAHGVTVDDIMKANGISNRDYIRTGQTIIIPQPERAP